MFSLEPPYISWALSHGLRIQVSEVLMVSGRRDKVHAFIID